MIAGQVYQGISSEELARIAEACGFSAHVEHSGGQNYVWITVAGRRTLASLIGGREAPSIVVFLTVLTEMQSTPAHANTFNLKKANWWTVYVNEQSKPVITMPVEVGGVSREHVAAKLFLWEYGVDEFISHFR